ncbi:MAG: mechanosensitive ion channel [Deltaproteobacteria bacterium]|jgi:small-conductance mechanosensitive channel|nr:mechanosensitive ion channel [Deltaproteobacteria bacterium]
MKTIPSALAAATVLLAFLLIFPEGAPAQGTAPPAPEASGDRSAEPRPESPQSQASADGGAEGGGGRDAVPDGPPARTAVGPRSPGGGSDRAGAAADTRDGQDGPDISVRAVRSSKESDLSRLSDLNYILESLSAQMSDESASISALITSTTEDSNNFRRQFQQRNWITPHVREDRMSQLRVQRDAIVQSEKTLDDLYSTFTRRLREFQSSLAASGPLSVDRAQALLSALSGFRETSEAVSARLAESQTFMNTLDERIARFEARIPAAWTAYYLESSNLTSFEIPDFTGEGGYISEWRRLVAFKRQLLYPQTFEAYQQSITRFLMTAGLITLMGLILYRGAAYFPTEPVNWKGAVLGIVKGPWIFLAVGLALCNASRNNVGVNFLFFLVPGVLILIWGIAVTSWKLRLAAKPTLTGQNSPLTRFYLPAVMAVFFLFAEIPTGVLSVLWFAILLVFMYSLWKRGRRSSVDEKLKGFLLERFAYGSAGYFAVISLIINVIGFPRLSVLVFMILFTLVNILILGNAFAELGSNLCNRIFPSDNHPVKYSILIALLLPCTWSASLLCTLPWLMAIPGLSSILMNFLTTGHSIGSASISISKILMILGFFFLFRSLRRFGSTSLDHLPEELELNEAQRVSIQTILTYLVWIAFAVIAMGLLGVNWTSLAVAAAGLGAGIGFGLQTFFNNILSGIILIFGRSVKVGDFVEVGRISGKVKKVDFRCTEVVALDGSLVFVPNSAIISNEFINWSTQGDEEKLKRTLVIRAFYGTPITLALKLMKDACKRVEGVLTDPRPQAVLNDLNEKYMEFNLMITVTPIEKTSAILSDLRVMIEKSFTKHKIKLYRQSLEINLREVLKSLQADMVENRIGTGRPSGPIIIS